MSNHVADVIQDDRLGLAWRGTQTTPHLLHVKPEALRGPQQDRRFDDRDVETL